MSETKDPWERWKNEADALYDRLSDEMKIATNGVFSAANQKINRAIEALPQRIRSETIDQLREMTDSVLIAQGHEAQETSGWPVVIFTYKPRLGHLQPTESDPGLKIYSIADGVGGFNTFSADSEGNTRPGDDNSRRWVVYMDRGTNFGSAYDNRGAAYEHGYFDASNLMGSIPSDEFEMLIDRYCGDSPERVGVEFYESRQAVA